MPARRRRWRMGRRDARRRAARRQDRASGASCSSRCAPSGSAVTLATPCGGRSSRRSCTATAPSSSRRSTTRCSACGRGRRPSCASPDAFDWTKPGQSAVCDRAHRSLGLYRLAPAPGARGGRAAGARTDPLARAVRRLRRRDGDRARRSARPLIPGAGLRRRDRARLPRPRARRRRLRARRPRERAERGARRRRRRVSSESSTSAGSGAATTCRRHLRSRQRGRNDPAQVRRADRSSCVRRS